MEMTTRITKPVLGDIHAHAESTYPDECCGLLIADKDGRIIESTRMANAYPGARHARYDIDPLEFLKVERAVARKGLSIAGVYHSHPDHPAMLSAFDLKNSFPWYSYVVVSVPRGTVGETRSWIPSDDRRTASEDRMEVEE
ncbi:MAG: M67 family metallopeptidase [Nitrososphaerales archaeon]|jgi:proteasome lid subunit RPN8/RPN11